jgi:hypothetical protein
LIVEEIGHYIDHANGKVFVVLKRTNEIYSRQISGNTQTFEGSYDYITACGVDLNPLDENENSFELIQKDGVIVKQSA